MAHLKVCGVGGYQLPIGWRVWRAPGTLLSPFLWEPEGPGSPAQMKALDGQGDGGGEATAVKRGAAGCLGPQLAQTGPDSARSCGYLP